MSITYITDTELEDILDKVITLFLIPRFKELGMNASGEWQNNIEKVVGKNKGTIKARAYSEQLAKGRAPGKMPPVSELERWVRVKFGKTGSEARSMAWAMAKKIEKEGTSWHQKGGSTLIEVLEEPRTIEYIQQQLGDILKVRISEQLIRNAQETFR